MRKLTLEKLQSGQSGITTQTGAYLAEAATVGLHLSGHQSKVQLEATFENTEKVVLEWQRPITLQMLKAWNDIEEATEFGAMGLAILLMNEFAQLEVVGRARKGDFSDYYLGDKITQQVVAELEVSGIFKANKNNSIAARVRLKEKQVSKNKQRNHAVYIIVVEFSHPRAKIVKK